MSGATTVTIHANRGSSMRSKLVAQLLTDVGVTKTHSRPHVSNDNPFSESGFNVLAAAQLAHPERFVPGAPKPPALPTAVWINKPKDAIDVRTADSSLNQCHPVSQTS